MATHLATGRLRRWLVSEGLTVATRRSLAVVAEAQRHSAKRAKATGSDTLFRVSRRPLSSSVGTVAEGAEAGFSAPLLRKLRGRHSLSIEAVPMRDLPKDLEDELYNCSRALMLEERQHWQRHADQQSEVHIFRSFQDGSDSGKVCGFQFWRYGDTCVPNVTLIFGGKLRIEKEQRQKGLHLISNLLAYDRAREQSAQVKPDSENIIARVGLLNVFGFSSIVAALDSWSVPPLPDGSIIGKAVEPELWKWTEGSGFFMDGSTYRVDVCQTSPVKPEQLSEEWWNRKGVPEFRKLRDGSILSPEETLSRANDSFLVWEFDRGNLESLQNAALRYLEE
mmetsp:Transcript_5612/g.13177  ORF Transcript_5612/g.13177 Transcript_5612/m.13177 type:complete len:336 (-) Transcript_5612:187-1194(-)